MNLPTGPHYIILSHTKTRKRKITDGKGEGMGSNEGKNCWQTEMGLAFAGLEGEGTSLHIIIRHPKSLSHRYCFRTLCVLLTTLIDKGEKKTHKAENCEGRGSENFARDISCYHTFLLSLSMYH